MHQFLPLPIVRRFIVQSAIVTIYKVQHHRAYHNKIQILEIYSQSTILDQLKVPCSALSFHALMHHSLETYMYIAHG